MALADDPQGHILHMFRREMGEKPFHRCEVFPEGARPTRLQLNTDEFVFGVYANKYFFTPTSLIVVDESKIVRVEWAEIKACSSKHGGGDERSVLTLADGTKITINVRDFGTGWGSRIDQLFHAMIDRWGAKATFGPPLLSIEEFFDHATDAYSIAPNLEPHPPLCKMREMLEAIGKLPTVLSLMIDVSDCHEGESCSQGIVIVSTSSAETFDDALKQLGTDGVFPADKNTRQKVGSIPAGAQVYQAIWD